MQLICQALDRPRPLSLRVDADGHDALVILPFATMNLHMQMLSTP